MPASPLLHLCLHVDPGALQGAGRSAERDETDPAAALASWVRKGAIEARGLNGKRVAGVATSIGLHIAALTLLIAVSYGGRGDIVRAARRLAERVARGELVPAACDEAAFAHELELAGVADPDLFIRTGGERRISNFLLWNLAYTELYFCGTLWPDFDDEELERAVRYFASRQRRFGLTGDQVAGD